MSTIKKTVSGCFDKLTIKYEPSNNKDGKPSAYFVTIYWGGKYTYRNHVVSHKKIKENQSSEPTVTDIEDYLYQTAIDRLYDVRDKFNNPVYRLA